MGGAGREQVASFYRRHFIGQWPAGTGPEQAGKILDKDSAGQCAWPAPMSTRLGDSSHAWTWSDACCVVLGGS